MSFHFRGSPLPATPLSPMIPLGHSPLSATPHHQIIHLGGSPLPATPFSPIIPLGDSPLSVSPLSQSLLWEAFTHHSLPGDSDVYTTESPENK